MSTDFTDGTYSDWAASGGATLSVVDVEGNPALQVANRTEDFDGIQTAPGLFADVEPGTELTLSMRARLAPDTVGSAGVRLVVKPAYTWVGNTTMTADAWTTVTGTYTVPADADPATLQVYIGTGALDGPYTYLVDDLTITAPAGEEPETPDVLPGGALNPTTTPVSAAQGTGNRSRPDVRRRPQRRRHHRAARLPGRPRTSRPRSASSARTSRPPAARTS